MAVDAALAERVRQALAGQHVIEKRMMGGICFMLGGHMCCGVSGAAVLVRVGREAYPEALQLPHVRPLEFGGRRPTGFVLVDPEAYAAEGALEAWVRRGVEFATTLPPKR